MNKIKNIISSMGQSVSFAVPIVGTIKPEDNWKIKKLETGSIYLIKNHTTSTYLVNHEWRWKQDFIDQFKNIFYKIAKEMNVLTTPVQMLDDNLNYKVYYHTPSKKWMIYREYFADSSLIIKDEASAIKIAILLNNSEAIKEWLEYCREEQNE